MALNSLFCADVPLSNYSLTHWGPLFVGAPVRANMLKMLKSSSDPC